MMEVGGFFFDFEAVRTESSNRDAAQVSQLEVHDLRR